MSWIFLVFSAVIFFTLQNLLQRVLAIKSENPRILSLLFNTISAFFALVIYFLSGSFSGFKLPSVPIAWVYLSVAVIGFGIFERLRFTVAGLLDASVFSIITNISILTAFIGALVLYREPLTLSKLVGAILIIFALILVSNYRGQKISKKGLYLAITISTLTGIAWTLDKMGTIYFKPDMYQVLVWFLPLPFIAFPAVKMKDIALELKISSWKIYAFAIFNVLGYWLQLRAVAVSEASRIIPLVNTSTLFTVLAAIIILKEHQGLKKKIIAGILAVTGVFLLTIQ